MLQIYCGDGKGKTTAALGQAVRAAGSGMRVHIVQLMKGRETGELHALAMIPNITVRRCDRDYGFAKNMDAAAREGITACHNAMLAEAESMLKELDMLVLDEFCSACENGLLDRALAERVVLQRPYKLELVLTGRRPAQIFLDAADYISEIAAVRHPFESGAPARKGIEY